MKPILKFLSLLLIANFCYSQSNCFSLLKDINKGPARGNISYITPINDKVALFFAEDEFYGRELWRTDGTDNGTYIIKDIHPGLRGSKLDRNHDYYSSKPVVLNGIMYFTAFSSTSGLSQQVWRSDGSELGTYQVTEDPSGVSNVPYFQIFNNIIYFWSGSKFYRTEGTKKSTKLVIEVNSQYSIKGMVEFNKSLWFSTGKEIWKTDGTSKGTIPIISFKYLEAPPLIVANNKLFFIADQPMYATLWQSDGTVAGTKIVREAIASNLKQLWTAKNIIYFIGKEKTLWRSDGTLHGTYQLTTKSPRQVLVFRDELYFTMAIDYNNQKGQIWKTDGTLNGTHTVINLAPKSDAFSFPVNISENNGFLYFYTDAGSVDSNEKDLIIKRQISGFWRSDRTVAGTQLICPLNSKAFKIRPSPVYNDPFYFYSVESNNAPIIVPMNGYSLFIGNEIEKNSQYSERYGEELYRLEYSK